MATVVECDLNVYRCSSDTSSSSSTDLGTRDAPMDAGYNVRPPLGLCNPPPSDQTVTDYSPIFHNTSRFRPFAEDINPETPRWQKDLDRQFTIIFKESVLSDYSIDEMATRTLQIVGSPTKSKVRSLSLAVVMHWTRMQSDSGNLNVSAPEVVFLVSRISHYLECISVHAKQDFLQELVVLCLEKLKITWRWFVDVSTGEELPLSRESLLVRVMAIITMIGHLFRGGQLRHGDALAGLEYLATFMPLPDAVATTYTLLLSLGPKFATEENGWHFLHHLFAKLSKFTLGRLPLDPICQLVFAINTLVEEWQSSLRTTLYHTSALGFAPGGNFRLAPLPYGQHHDPLM
ncbi:hypothetical protein PAXRUDRAFT_9360 [Paxillus rubicundulus Ve08.2h10]|uniref:Uncharacterized protein n=1 Tax=Paxillus rubicundulus Ve08.2h10 TaxID=930991 RepID=A0A0D0EC41_9AGAM|nr:hypothetical protein PAXRUDRAFT_9360 [Paxillus rubicundulus Ve08.2h10]